MSGDAGSHADAASFVVWADVFRKVSVGQGKLLVAECVDDNWLHAFYDEIGSNADDDAGTVSGAKAGPAGIGQVYVKRYRYRPGHSLVRRLGPNRARREGAGYRAFARKGIPTPRLLVYGDTRKTGLFVKGLVATAMLDAVNLVDHYRTTGEEEMIVAAARFLAHIHTSGLAHGDACLRNYLVSGSSAMALDLPSWSRFTRKAWLNDLTRFLGSGLKLTSDDALVTHVMDEYLEAFGRLPSSRTTLIAHAQTYAAETNRP